MSLFEVLEPIKPDEVLPFPDYQYVGDLGLLGPLPKPSLMRFVKGRGGFNPDEDFKSGIENKINGFFADKGWSLFHEWKTSPMWGNFEYAVALVDDSANKNAGGFTYDSIIGLLVAFSIETPLGFNVKYYDKIGVRRNKRGNGYMPDLIKEARSIDLELDKEREPEKLHPTPAALRTSENENDERYGKISDYRMRFPGCAEKDTYFVHVFGFKDENKKPITPYVERMHELGKYISSLPNTFKKAA